MPNDLEVLSADVAGAYLNASSQEHVHKDVSWERIQTQKRGPASVDDARTLWLTIEWKDLARTHCFNTLDHMVSTIWDSGYLSCKADPDVWMCAKTKLGGLKQISSGWWAMPLEAYVKQAVTDVQTNC
jgi:hypothetical protein